MNWTLQNSHHSQRTTTPFRRTLSTCVNRYFPWSLTCCLSTRLTRKSSVKTVRDVKCRRRILMSYMKSKRGAPCRTTRGRRERATALKRLRIRSRPTVPSHLSIKIWCWVRCRCMRAEPRPKFSSRIRWWWLLTCRQELIKITLAGASWAQTLSRKELFSREAISRLMAIKATIDHFILAQASLRKRGM